jgi:hypothetical protein
MIPLFSPAGLLPAGIHSATIAECEERFAQFDQSDRRIRLFENVRRLYEEVRKVPFIRQMFLVGSFVTAKSEPNDFDCLLVIDGDQFPSELRPFEYRLVTRRAAAREFGGDVVSVIDGSELHRRYLAFFQTTRDGDPAGIIELDL